MRSGRTSIFILAAFFAVGGLALAPQARAGGSRHAYYLGAGALFSDLYRTSGSPSGAVKPVGSVYNPLQFSAHYPVGALSLVPILAGTPLAKRDSDSSVAKRIFVFALAVEKETWLLDLRLGAGVRFYNQMGAGGTVVLDNGNTTSTFTRPAFSSTARNLVVELGVGRDIIPIGKRNAVRLDLELWGISIASSRRAVDAGVTVSWGWI